MDQVTKETAAAKRERSVNFTPDETDLLLSLTVAKKYVIENKKSDSATWREKEKAWKDIEDSFNSLSGAVFRDHKHLKLKYEAIKRDTRRKMAMSRAGGTNISSVLTPAEQKVKDMILSVEGIESASDSDLDLSNSSNFNILEDQQEYIEPPRKKIFELSHDEDSLQSNPKEKIPFGKLTYERMEIAEIRKKIICEELEQQLIKRDILEKQTRHKEIMQELEKQHLLLKIEKLKKELQEK